MAQNRRADVRALALRMRQYPELDAAFVLQQIEALQKAEHKLPELAAIEGWLWPKRLSVEQCSSQVTALYKKAVLEKWKIDNGQWTIGGKLIDLTGGLGVDTYYLSEGFEEVHYVERDEDLCRLAEHNFALTGKSVQVHCCSAEEFLEETYRAFEPEETTIFIDPARRSAHGGKVFRLADCEPNVVELLSILRTHARRILLKLSPMLDITEAVRELGEATEVHVVAVRNEVKEVLVLLQSERDSMDPEITCVNLETEEERFVFRKSEEEHTPSPLRGTPPTLGGELILVEPNSAIIKAGAYKVFAERYGLRKLDVNSHLYFGEGVLRCIGESTETVRKRAALFGESERCEVFGESNYSEYSEQPLFHLPGRVFRVHVAQKEELKNIKQANVICRNYPLSAEALKKKLKLKDGGEKYVIATKIGDKPTIFLGTRQFFHK